MHSFAVAISEGCQIASFTSNLTSKKVISQEFYAVGWPQLPNIFINCCHSFSCERQFTNFDATWIHVVDISNNHVYTWLFQFIHIHVVIAEAESAVFDLEWSTNKNRLLLSWAETGGFPRNSIEVKELKCRDQYKLYLTTSYQPASGRCIDMNMSCHKTQTKTHLSFLYFCAILSYIS